jgi:CP family cyanate transporter-like MFS transporter
LTKVVKRSLFAILALIFISLVLRPPVGSIGPLVDELQKVEGLTGFQVGLLTSLPVVCFGIGAFASPALVRRLTLNRAMMWVLIALFLAMIFRLFGGYIPLISFTLIIGLAIAVGNVLIPTIVREQFPKNLELITGVYVTLLAISASLSATIAVPTSEWLGGWRMALAIWLIPTLAAIIFWYPLSKISAHKEVTSEATHAEERRAVLVSPLAWAIVAFFGLQSAGFYAILNWLPSLLIDRGFSPLEAGSLLGLTTSIGIPSGFLISVVIKRFKVLSALAVIVSAFTLSGLIILFLFPDQAILACVITGFGFAATFPLSLTLIGSRASTSTQTTQLSALSQGYGYLIAALGAFAFGYLKDLTGNWSLSLIVLIGITAVQLVAGAYAGRDQRIAAR